MKGVNFVLSSAERVLNIAGTIPVICIASGTLRIELSKIQMIAGTTLAIVGSVLAVGASLVNSPEKKQLFGRLAVFGVEQMIHSQLNLYRGMVETFLGISTFGIANVALGAGQVFRLFSPIVSYGVLTNRFFIPIPKTPHPIGA